MPKKSHEKPSKIKPKRPIRILSIADFHCGNVAGLTPDEFNPDSQDSYRAHVYREALWKWYTEQIEALKPIDICVANGDLIDGKGLKSGGNEQIYTSRTKQIEMAVACLRPVEAAEYHFTYGTGYHVGPEDDWEVQIAQEFGAGVEDVLTLEPNGLRMRWRHHIGGSLSPTSRATPLLRQQEWDILWSVDGEFERADVMIFGHTHYFQSIANRFGTAVIAPALQGLGGSQLGARRMGGIVDYGFLHFDVTSRAKWTMTPHLLKQTHRVRGGLLPLK